MIRILLCATNDGIAERLRAAIGDGFIRIAPAALPPDTAALAALVGDAGPPDVAIIEAIDVNAALALAEDLRYRTTARVILVSPTAEDIAYAALRAGVSDVLPPWADTELIRGALDRIQASVVRPAAAQPILDPPGQAGQILTVTSPKGGVGKTTVATNLAVGLALRAPQEVVLVDADLHFGDVASALNLSPEQTLPEMVRGAAGRDSIALKGVLARHSTGLFVIPGSDSPAAADAVSAADLGGLLEMLRGLFRHVVVDTAPGLTEHTLGVLDHTDALVLVTSLDVPGVRGLRKELDTLAQLNLVPGSRHIVVNFHDDNRGLSVADVEATIRAKVDLTIPVSTVIPLSTNQGITLVQSNGRDPASRKLRELVDLVDGGEPAVEGRRGRRWRRK